MRIGVDLGGTKIEAIALADDGRVLARERVPAPRGVYRATIEAIVALVSTVRTRAGNAQASVGIGIPGAVSPATGLVKNANSTWLIGRPLERDLAESLGQAVRIENDANCFAVSEATDGAAAGASVVFGVILGTGVGAGIVVDGRPLRGRMAIAGEWGHNRLPLGDDPACLAIEWPGPACYCGRRGCIETFLSGPALAALHQAAYPRTDIATAESLIDAMRAGDEAAIASFSLYLDRLARALASVINVLDPDVIVLGGGLSQVKEIYDELPLRWGRYVFSDRVDTRLVAPLHGDASGVRGAAWLWPAVGQRLQGPARAH